MQILVKLIICLIAGAGAGIGTGFAGMSAAAIIGPMLSTFTGMSAYQALGIGLISDVLASAISAWIYHKHGNLDIKNSLPLLISVLCMTVVGSLIGSFVPNSWRYAADRSALRGLKIPAQTAENHEGADEGRGSEKPFLQSRCRWCDRRLYLWLYRRRRRHDAALCPVHFSLL